MSNFSGAVELSRNRTDYYLHIDHHQSPETIEPRALLSSEAEDFMWIQAAGRGDEQAFAQLVKKYHATVIRVSTRLLGGDEAEAHDIAQQVFVRMWKAAARFEPTAKFTTWMFTIVRNQVFSETRRRQRRPTVPLSPTFAKAPDETEANDDHRAEWQDHRVTSPDEQLLKEELWKKIDQAILALPEQQRLALTLKRYEDFSYEEIAEIMKTTVSSVKSLLFRARAELRNALEQYLK